MIKNLKTMHTFITQTQCLVTIQKRTLPSKSTELGISVDWVEGALQGEKTTINRCVWRVSGNSWRVKIWPRQPATTQKGWSVRVTRWLNGPIVKCLRSRAWVPEIVQTVINKTQRNAGITCLQCTQMQFISRIFKWNQWHEDLHHQWQIKVITHGPSPQIWWTIYSEKIVSVKMNRVVTKSACNQLFCKEITEIYLDSFWEEKWNSW